MEVAECRYRGRVIGWLVEDDAGYLRYVSDTPMAKYLARRVLSKNGWRIPFDAGCY